MVPRVLLPLCIVAAILGCGSESKTDQPSSAKDGQQKQGDVSSEPGVKPQPKELVKAETGVGKQGQNLEKPNVNRVIAQPAKTLFAARQRVVFDIQIPQALNLYKATNGNLPKSHDEFMQKIIQENQIALPELPSGQRYVWDADAGELMVERPTQ